MMVYSTQSKGYKIWDVESSKLVISRNIIFNEPSVNSLEVQIQTNEVTNSNVAGTGGEMKKEVDGNIDSSPEQSDNRNGGTVRKRYPVINSEGDNDGEFEDGQERSASATISTPPAETAPRLRRSARVSKPPVRYGFNLLSQALVAQEVPTSFKSATSPENIDLCQPGIDRKHDCLLRNKTWQLVDYKQGVKVLPCNYVFKIKENKPKVRLFALGCRKMYGVDYNERYAPIVTFTRIRTMLSVVSTLDLELEQMGVVTAFLNGDLHEDVDMSVPEGN